MMLLFLLYLLYIFVYHTPLMPDPFPLLPFFTISNVIRYLCVDSDVAEATQIPFITKTHYTLTPNYILHT